MAVDHGLHLARIQRTLPRCGISTNCWCAGFYAQVEQHRAFEHEVIGMSRLPQPVHPALTRSNALIAVSRVSTTCAMPNSCQ